MKIPQINSTVQVIVKRPKGSWKWQNAYAISTYKLCLNKRNKLVWKFVSRTDKKSKPQLGELWSKLSHGRPSFNSN